MPLDTALTGSDPTCVTSLGIRLSGDPADTIKKGTLERDVDVGAAVDVKMCVEPDVGAAVAVKICVEPFLRSPAVCRADDFAALLLDRDVSCACLAATAVEITLSVALNGLADLCSPRNGVLFVLCLLSRKRLLFVLVVPVVSLSRCTLCNGLVLPSLLALATLPRPSPDALDKLGRKGLRSAVLNKGLDARRVAEDTERSAGGGRCRRAEGLTDRDKDGSKCGRALAGVIGTMDFSFESPPLPVAAAMGKRPRVGVVTETTGVLARKGLSAR